MRKYTIDELYINQYYETDVCVTEEMGIEFAEISKDYNPIHLNTEIAENSRFGKKIVHGMLVGSYFSGIIGSEFPGEGSIYISQNFLFKRPVYYNTRLKIRIKVMNINSEKKHLLLKTECMDDNGKVLVDGEAKILFEN